MRMEANGGQSDYRFAYNADGILTSKTIGGQEHRYLLNGSQIVAEEFGIYCLVYLYDENGAPVGLQYRNKTYGTYTFDTYYFEKNLQGDVIAIYTESGTKIGSYTYDAWGNCTSSYHVIIGLYRNSKDEYFLVRRIYSTYSSSDYNQNWAIITGYDPSKPLSYYARRNTV